MKYSLLLGLMFFLVLNLRAQEPFSMFLVFADSLGHQDSILVGYDPDKPPTGFHLHPDYDGQINDSPFDSILEVRGGYDLYYMLDDGEMTDTLIGQYGGDCKPIGVMASIWLLIYSKYPPITISWDSVALNASYCRSHSIFQNNEFAPAAPEELDPFILNDHSSFVPLFDAWQFNGNDTIPQSYFPVEVLGMGEVEVPLLIFDMKTDVWTGTEEKEYTPGIRIWPNPGDGRVYLDGLQPGILKVFSLDGSLVSEQIINKESKEFLWDLRVSSSGLYWITFWQNGHLIWREAYIQSE